MRGLAQHAGLITVDDPGTTASAEATAVPALDAERARARAIARARALHPAGTGRTAQLQIVGDR